MSDLRLCSLCGETFDINEVTIIIASKRGRPVTVKDKDGNIHLLRNKRRKAQEEGDEVLGDQS